MTPDPGEQQGGQADSSRRQGDASTGEPTSELQRTVLLTGVDLSQFLGVQDELVRDLERQHSGVEFHVRDHVLTLRGPASQVTDAERVVLDVLEVARRSGAVSRHDVREATRMVMRGEGPTAAQMLSEPILTVRGHAIRAQTQGQRAYVDGIEHHTVTFGIGPAGTGKTYLAMAKAVQALQRREVAKIILTRPAVEAGERLGFLPGSLEEKIDPYLRPLFDAIGSMMEQDTIPKLMASGTIEVAPLAYMRGRTLNESFVILDEAQNTTPEQMKMFLTRLGYGSKMVVTGDITQLDLPVAASGLRVVNRILRGVDDIHFADLTTDDIVRHSLVGRIVDAYTAYEEQRAAHRQNAKGQE